MTQIVLLSALMLLVACNGGGTTNPDPPAPPPPGTLMTLEPSLKPIPSSALTTRPPQAGEFWVGKGKTVKFTVKANQLSPLAKKAQLEVSASGAFLEVTPRILTLQAGQSAEITVALNSQIDVTKEPIPYWFLYGFALGENDRKLDEQLRLDFRWNLALPPATTP